MRKLEIFVGMVLVAGPKLGEDFGKIHVISLNPAYFSLRYLILSGNPAWGQFLRNQIHALTAHELPCKYTGSGAQWLSARVLVSRLEGLQVGAWTGSLPCVELEQDTLILASSWFYPGMVPT